MTHNSMKLRIFAVAAGFSALAGCATPPPPAPAGPPPVAVPSRPVPPNGASPSMYIPPANAVGVRQTVNTNVSSAQRIWNLRSAFVVASLNCMDPVYAPILEGYKRFLVSHKKELSKTNEVIEKEWKSAHGAAYKRARDSYTTQVYNYFSLPPTIHDFCNASLQMSNDSLSVVPGQLEPFATQEMPKLEAVFNNFFRSFEQYRANVALWDAQYGALYGRPQTVRLSADYPAPASGQNAATPPGPASQPSLAPLPNPAQPLTPSTGSSSW
jgi:hypothetical protein